MQVLAPVLATVVGIAAGLAAGFALGAWSRKTGSPAAWFGAFVVVAFAAGIMTSWSGQVSGRLWLTLGGVGLLGGALTGLRYGFGQPFGALLARPSAEVLETRDEPEA